jgi:amidase
MERTEMTTIPDSLAFHGLIEIGELIQDRSVSSRAVTEALLQRIARLDRELRAYVQVLETSALAQADAADREIAAGHHRGPRTKTLFTSRPFCMARPSSLSPIPRAASAAWHRCRTLRTASPPAN